MSALHMLGAKSPSLDDVQAEVAVVSKRVSPWLWILSVSGTLMAIKNTVQIGKMYGNWKAARRALGK